MTVEQCQRETVSKLKIIANKNICAKKYRKALDAIAAASNILYHWNQCYIDDELEAMVKVIASELIHVNMKPKDNNTILFYDGFGLDTRGLVIIYLKALGKCGYTVKYVTDAYAKNNQPELVNAVKGLDVEWCYLSYRNNLEKLQQLHKVFEVYKPSKAFFYTMPDDVSASVVFCGYENIVTRFQINLTDHAYWLGLSAFDYCIEFRDYGACITNQYRKIGREKIVKLPYYPYYREREFQGFPFDTTGKRVMFSGGSLYKTLGDENNAYYNIVYKTLDRHQDVIFLYAGNGDDSELKKLVKSFPDRVHHMQERQDLYQVMENISVYLNTYPMIGGLMMQYAAKAGIVPVTYRPQRADMDAEGILLNQDSVEYESIEKVILEIDNLLSDREYHEKRAKLPEQDKVNENRRKIANKYLKEINNPYIKLPVVPNYAEPVWHIFGIRCERREELEKYLNDAGIATNKHYPIPIHLQGAYKELGYKIGDFPISEEISQTELSIPMYYSMAEEEISYVISKINEFRVVNEYEEKSL